MAGTSAGAHKAVATRKARYGENHYHTLRAKKDNAPSVDPLSKKVTPKELHDRRCMECGNNHYAPERNTPEELVEEFTTKVKAEEKPTIFSRIIRRLAGN